MNTHPVQQHTSTPSQSTLEATVPGRSMIPPPFQLKATPADVDGPGKIAPKKFAYSGYGGDIVCDPAKTTTLIGRYDSGTGTIAKQHSYNVWGGNKGGISLLKIDPWSLKTNMQWLDQALSRKDNIRLVSDPDANTSLFRSNPETGENDVNTVFSLELARLKTAGSHKLDNDSVTFKSK